MYFRLLTALVVTLGLATSATATTRSFDFSVILDNSQNLPGFVRYDRLGGNLALNVDALSTTGPSGDASSARYGSEVFAGFRFNGFNNIAPLVNFQIGSTSYMETFDNADYELCTSAGRGGQTCTRYVVDGWRMVLVDAILGRTFMFELLDTTGQGQLVSGTGLADQFLLRDQWEQANVAFYGEILPWNGRPEDFRTSPLPETLLGTNHGSVAPFFDSRCRINMPDNCRSAAAPVPLPASLPLAIGGLGLLWGVARRRNRRV